MRNIENGVVATAHLTNYGAGFGEYIPPKTKPTVYCDRCGERITEDLLPYESEEYETLCADCYREEEECTY